MIGLSGSSPFDIYDFVVLPNGYKVLVSIKGHYEYDTNASVVDDLTIEWPGGIELTVDEQNEMIGDVYLHEYVVNKLTDGE